MQIVNTILEPMSNISEFLNDFVIVLLAAPSWQKDIYSRTCRKNEKNSSRFKIG